MRVDMPGLRAILIAYQEDWPMTKKLKLLGAIAVLVLMWSTQPATAAPATGCVSEDHCSEELGILEMVAAWNCYFAGATGAAGWGACAYDSDGCYMGASIIFYCFVE
jgi:hypothetical protein